MIKIKLCGVAACLLIALAAKAQNHSSEAGLQTDNDSYLLQGSDRYYTDGLFLFYRHALKTGDSTSLKNKVLGFEVGQKIYNPRTANIPAARFVDRPFAGYLYIATTLNLLYANESNLKLGVQTGIIGPGSGAKEAQTYVHSTFGFYPVNGWQYQVRNAFQLNLSAEYNRLLARDGAFDISLSTYGNLGASFNGAGLGPSLRLGRFNPLYNSVTTQSTVTSKAISESNSKGEFFIHYKPMFNYVAYDATIQGGLFGGERPAGSQEITFTPNRFILTQQAGVSFTTKRWVLDYTATFTSKQIKGMVYTQQWASITALYRFN